MPKNKNTPPLPTVGHHTEDGSYVEIPSIPGGSKQAPPVNPDSNHGDSRKSFKAHLSQNINALPEPSTTAEGEKGARTLDSKANTYAPQMPDEIKEQNKQKLLRHIREASKYKTSNRLEEEFSTHQPQANKKDPVNPKTKQGRQKPQKDNSKLVKLIAVIVVVVSSLIIIFGVGMALTKKENNLPPLITPKQEQYREKPKPVADTTLQKTARIYADGEGKVMSNKVEHILSSPEQPLSLEEIKKGKGKIIQENAPDTEGINSHLKDSHGFENEALNNKTKDDINKATTQELMANAQNITPKSVDKSVDKSVRTSANKPVLADKAKTDTTRPVGTSANKPVLADKVKTDTTQKPKVSNADTTRPVGTSANKPVVAEKVKTHTKIKPIKPIKPITIKPIAITPIAKNTANTSNTVTSNTSNTVTSNTVTSNAITNNTVTNTNKNIVKPVTKPVPVVIPTVVAKDHNKWEVQLVATVSKPLAERFWKKAVIKSAGVLKTQPVYKTVVVNKKSYIRLRTGSFKTRADAKNFCAKLKTLGIDCSPTSK